MDKKHYYNTNSKTQLKQLECFPNRRRTNPPYYLVRVGPIALNNIISTLSSSASLT